MKRIIAGLIVVIIVMSSGYLQWLPHEVSGFRG
jgi:hypothetical protein